MVWDSETDEIMTNVSVEYTMGSSYWSCNGLIVISDLLADYIVVQQYLSRKAGIYGQHI